MQFSKMVKCKTWWSPLLSLSFFVLLVHVNYVAFLSTLSWCACPKGMRYGLAWSVTQCVDFINKSCDLFLFRKHHSSPLLFTLSSFPPFPPYLLPSFLSLISAF